MPHGSSQLACQPAICRLSMPRSLSRCSKQPGPLPWSAGSCGAHPLSCMMLQQVVFCALQGGSGLKLGAARRVPQPPATQSGLCKRAALCRHLELLQLQARVLRLADVSAAAATATEAMQQHSTANGLQADVEDDSSRCSIAPAAASTRPAGK